MLLGGSVSPWRSGVEEGRSPLGRFRKPEPCFPRTYATWDAKKDENRFGSVKFRLTFGPLRMVAARWDSTPYRQKKRGWRNAQASLIRAPISPRSGRGAAEA